MFLYYTRFFAEFKLKLIFFAFFQRFAVKKSLGKRCLSAEVLLPGPQPTSRIRRWRGLCAFLFELQILFGVPVSHNELLPNSIGSVPFSASARLIAENGRLPKNPRYAESGDGCADCMTVCRAVSISGSFFCAGPPQSTNTTGRGNPLTVRMTESVNSSQPCF